MKYKKYGVGGSRKGRRVYALRHNTAHDHADIENMIGYSFHYNTNLFIRFGIW